ncbi:hypothetical protein ACNQ1D_25795, partial [Enterobacter cloacae complex sp.6700005]
MKMTKPKPVSRMKRPFISELAELGLSGEILSIRTDGMQGTLIPDLTAGVSEAGRVKTGNWVISDKRTFDHVVLCVERQDENHDVYVGVLGIFRPKTTKCSGGPAVCGLQRGITFFEIPI